MKNISYVKFSCGRLWTEFFGDPSNPLVVLITGAAKQGVYWRPLLCQALADGGYCIVRYDHRDTGLSTHINFNANPYRLDDIASDVRGIINHYDHDKQGAHVVGCGMGGYVAQLLALNWPESVKSLILLMSTYNAIPIEHPQSKHSLPSMKPEVFEKIESIGRILPHDPNWFDKTMHELQTAPHFFSSSHFSKDIK